VCADLGLAPDRFFYARARVRDTARHALSRKCKRSPEPQRRAKSRLQGTALCFLPVINKQRRVDCTPVVRHGCLVATHRLSLRRYHAWRSLDAVVQIRLFVKLKLRNCARAGTPHRAFSCPVAAPVGSREGRPGGLNGPVGCLVFCLAMQSRTPRLGWIAQVLADPDAPRQRDERAPLRLVSEGIRGPRRSRNKPPTLVPAGRDRRSGGPIGPHPKAGR
jgi:hypothetical protein